MDLPIKSQLHSADKRVELQAPANVVKPWGGQEIHMNESRPAHRHSSSHRAHAGEPTLFNESGEMIESLSIPMGNDHLMSYEPPAPKLTLIRPDDFDDEANAAVDEMAMDETCEHAADDDQSFCEIAADLKETALSNDTEWDDDIRNFAPMELPAIESDNRLPPLSLSPDDTQSFDGIVNTANAEPAATLGDDHSTVGDHSIVDPHDVPDLLAMASAPLIDTSAPDTIRLEPTEPIVEIQCIQDPDETPTLAEIEAIIASTAPEPAAIDAAMNVDALAPISTAPETSSRAQPRRPLHAPRRIGSGSLVPAKLTWRPGDPFADAVRTARNAFRWEVMLTTACVTAACGMGCIWLLRSILA